jgi:integrase
MPPDILVALCTLALVRNEPHLCAALLLGFVGLLRSGEIVQLVRSQLTFLSTDKLVIALPDSKGAKRSGQPEHVIVYEAPIVRFVKSLVADLSPSDAIYSCSHASLGDDIRRLASLIGLHHPSLTPYTLRRGGATWLYQQTLSFDVVQDKGRWSEARTCKIYVNTATAEIGRASIPEWGSARVKLCNKIFPYILADTSLLREKPCS